MDARAPLLAGLFDHAGMFPPASKAFEEALRDAATFGSTLAEPDLVGTDMVLTEDTLPRLTDDALDAAGWTGDDVCTVCLVGVPVEHASDAARAVVAWNENGTSARHPRRIVALELVFDDPLEDGPTEVAAHATAARHLLRESGVGVFVEPRWPEADTRARMDRLTALLDALAEDTEMDPAGLKVRCAGDTALGPEALAAVVPEVAARSLPFKATQGLHHPVAGGGNLVGFLGLTTGLRLAQVRGLRGQDLADCIAETDGDAFGFDNGVSWRDHHIALGDLGAAMAAVPFSIGSCSLHEPDQDLQRL